MPPPEPIPITVANIKGAFVSQQQQQKPSLSRRSIEHNLTATMLPLARCSSTPSQPNNSPGNGGGSHRNSQGSSGSERPVEPTSSCIFGRANPFDTDFSVKELVGEGGFGKIFKCRSTVDGRWYAVKLEQFWFKPQAFFNPEDLRATLMKEALVLARLDHENVCRYFNTWVFGSLVSVDKLLSGDKNKSLDKPGKSPTVKTKRRSESQSNRRSSTTSSSSDWDDDEENSDGDEDQDDLFINTRRSRLSFDEDNDGSVGFSDLGFDMEEQDDEDSGDETSTSQPRSSAPVVASLPPPAAIVKPRTQFRKRLLSLESPHASVGPVCTQIDVYIQMALYEGNSLQFWLDQRRALDGSTALRIFQQIVAGLRYVHSEGLVHRDVKPANVFLTKDSCQVKLGDFGLAKNTVEASLRIPPSQYFYDLGSDIGNADSSSLSTRRQSEDDSLNTCSAGVGTPMYSSPEQIAGCHDCDASTDVYSLGVLLCELFCVFSTQMERCIVLTAARKGEMPASLAAQYPKVALLIQRMVQQDRTKRPTCAEIEQSELFFHRRLCNESQQQKLSTGTISTSTPVSHYWQPVVSPPGSPVAGSVFVQSRNTSAVSPMTAIFSTAVSKKTSSLITSDKATKSHSPDTLERLLREVCQLEDDEEALFVQLKAQLKHTCSVGPREKCLKSKARGGKSGGITATAGLLEKAKSLQRERRTRLTTMIEMVNTQNL